MLSTSEGLKDIKPLNLKRLGIDEIALVKGHGNYCAVLVDLDRSKVIAILSERLRRSYAHRKQDTIKKVHILLVKILDIGHRSKVYKDET
jgi:transposase